MSKYKLPKIYTPSDTFRVELTADQMNFLSALIPPGYSLQLEPRKNVPKNSLPASKKKPIDLANPHADDSLSQQQKREQNPKNNKKLPQAPSATLVDKSASLKSGLAGKWAEGFSEPLKKCAKVFGLLKSHKSSWPFLEPVNAEALGIPEYYEIIKEPMDLSKIESKLRAEKYGDFGEFQGDVLKIIENSYRFNEANEEFLKLTSEFENFFNRILADPQESRSAKNPAKKKKKSSAAREGGELAPVTLMEKKQLAQQIRRLGKEHIKTVAAIVFELNESPQDLIDLEKVGEKKLRELQKFVRQRIIQMEERARSSLNDKNELTNLDIYDSDESSFPTDGAC